METFNKTLTITLFFVGGLVAFFSGHIWTAVFGLVAAELVYRFLPTTE